MRFNKAYDPPEKPGGSKPCRYADHFEQSEGTSLKAKGVLMIPCDYTAENGRKVVFDLDSVIDVAVGFSKKKQGWTATMIYIQETCAFVELRSSPQDIRGNSKEEAEEVSSAYISEAFAIDSVGLTRVKNDPGSWHLIDRRTGAYHGPWTPTGAEKRPARVKVARR